jgi:3-phosphoshikimate 1-carboxyvinyltransferase
LAGLGIDITELEDGFIINGHPGRFTGGRVDSLGDHRMAMSLAVAGFLGRQETIIQNAEAVDISFPQFWNLLQQITQK